MGRKPADPEAGPKSVRHRYHCPNPECRHTFTRKTRLGIWATCPKCKTRTYGPKVISDLAKQAAAATPSSSAKRAPAKAQTARKAPARKAANPPPSTGSPSTAATPAPPAPPAPAVREPSWWERAVGAGDLA